MREVVPSLARRIPPPDGSNSAAVYAANLLLHGMENLPEHRERYKDELLAMIERLEGYAIGRLEREGNPGVVCVYPAALNGLTVAQLFSLAKVGGVRQLLALIGRLNDDDARTVLEEIGEVH